MPDYQLLEIRREGQIATIVLKRIEKRKKAREKRAARKPAPPPSAPAVASPLMPAEGAAPVPGAPAGQQHRPEGVRERPEGD